MKLSFEPNLQYQQDAIIIDLRSALAVPKSRISFKASPFPIKNARVSKGFGAHPLQTNIETRCFASPQKLLAKMPASSINAGTASFDISDLGTAQAERGKLVLFACFKEAKLKTLHATSLRKCRYYTQVSCGTLAQAKAGLIVAQAEKISQLSMHRKGLMQGFFPDLNS